MLQDLMAHRYLALFNFILIKKRHYTSQKRNKEPHIDVFRKNEDMGSKQTTQTGYDQCL